MISDVPGLINPIIQAMMEARQNQNQQADQQLRTQALNQQAAYQLAESKHADATLAETQRQHDQQMEYNRDHLNKVLIPQFQAALEKEGLESARTKAILHGQLGVDLNSIQGVPYGNNGPVDKNAGFPDQATYQASQQNALRGNAEATASGTTAGQLSAALSPLGQQNFDREQSAERDKEDRLQQGRVDLETLRGTQRLAESDNNNAAAMSRLKADWHHQQLAAMSGDPAISKAKTLLEGIYNANVDPDKLSKEDKELVTNYASKLGETYPTGAVFKGYKQSLDNASAAQGILSQAKDFAQKYSVDSPNSTNAGNYNARLGILGTIGSPGTDENGLLPGSKAKAAFDGLGTTVGKFIGTLEGSGRMSDPNLKRQLMGIANPKSTIDSNQKNIDDKAGLINQIIRSGTQGVPPDRVNVALRNRGITAFGQQNSPVAYKDKDPTGTLGSNDGGKTMYRISDGVQFDPKTGVPIQ